VLAPRVAPSRPTPPGRKRSKGNRALAGARGVFYFPRAVSRQVLLPACLHIPAPPPRAARRGTKPLGAVVTCRSRARRGRNPPNAAVVSTAAGRFLPRRRCGARATIAAGRFLPRWRGGARVTTALGGRGCRWWRRDIHLPVKCPIGENPCNPVCGGLRRNSVIRRRQSSAPQTLRVSKHRVHNVREKRTL
jgi:hypothetical protein